MKAIVSQSYAGKSASQQVKAAQWTGQFAWNPNDHPSRNSRSTASGSGPANWQSNVDYNKPWFEKKDGEFYCNLCSAWATDGHVASEKHKTRESNPQWYGFGGGQPVQRTEPWFEHKDGMDYCNLCGAYATDGHLESEKHRKRAANPEWYGFPPSSGSVVPCEPALPEPWVRYFSEEEQAPWYHNPVTKVTQWEFPEFPSGASDPVTTSMVVASSRPPQYNHPWFEQREGEWFCLLCNCWAPDTHLGSSKHEKRAAWPGSYGFPDAGVQLLQQADQLPIVDRSPAAYQLQADSVQIAPPFRKANEVDV